jgi:hypothetical protein
MQYDALLDYLSEVGESSWAQFKRAVRAVMDVESSPEAAIVARALSALGHIEYIWYPSARWAVCPPTLVLLPRRSTPTAILCGQRSPLLLQSIAAETAHRSISMGRNSQCAGPAVLTFQAMSMDDLEDLAASCRIGWAPRAVEQLAACLPPLDTLVAASPVCPHPVVPPLARFDIHSYEWIEADEAIADGLYQYENVTPDYRLCIGGQWRRVTKEVGVYTLLSRTLWKYDPSQQYLRIPARLLPPPLYQRAMVLCSGHLAAFDSNERAWVYQAVPPAVAITLARKLRQPLEEIC